MVRPLHGVVGVHRRRSLDAGSPHRDVRVRSSGGSALLHVLVVGFGLAWSAGTARADDASTKVEVTGDKAADREIGLLPLIGGDTDNGFGAGAIGSIAMFDRAHSPYRWKIEYGAFYATKGKVFDPSFEDAFAQLTFPQLLNRKLRVEIRPSFTKETALRYFGVGNYAPDPKVIDPQRDFYTRVHPALAIQTLWVLRRPWYYLIGASYTWNQIRFDPESTLARDTRISDPDLERSHGVLKLDTGVVYDTRDNELSPSRGQFHQVKLRVSPRIGDELPYAYQQINVTARFYVTIEPRWLILAFRSVFDLQLGNVPIYELSRYEDTSAIGGGLGVRGVPAYRFYGKVKAFGNAELRSETFRFSAHDKPFILGFAAFFDAGRLWSDVERYDRNMDGVGLDLHYGIGGGIRLQQGRSFLVRADVAWSPDARPIGAYLQANHAF